MKNKNFREFNIEKGSEDFVYELSFASEEPYLRYFGYEVIDLSTIDLTRLNNKAALLFNHDRDKVIGVVEKAWIDELSNKAMATVRLDDTNEEAQKIKKSVDNGIISKVSFGYEVLEYKYIGIKDKQEVYKAKVNPFEISIVTVPADDTVKISKKDFEELLISYNEESKDLSEKDMETQQTKQSQTQEKEKETVTEQVKEASYNEEANSIIELANMIGEKELALDFIAEQKSFKDFKEVIKQKREISKPLNIKENLQMEKENQKSLGSLIKDLAKDKRSASFRDFTGVTVEGYGAELKQSSFSEVISNTIDNSVLGKMGYNILRNIIGDVYTFRTVDDVEGGAVYSEGSKVAGGKLKTSGHRAIKQRFSLPLKFSYELLKQTEQNIENVIINEGLRHTLNYISDDILKVIVNDDKTTRLNKVGNYKEVLSLESEVKLRAGATPKFLTTNKGLNTLKGIAKFEGAGQPIADGVAIDGQETVLVSSVGFNPADFAQAGEPVFYGDFNKVGVLLDDPEIFINTYPDDEDMFEVKFIVSYAAVVTADNAIAFSSIA